MDKLISPRTHITTACSLCKKLKKRCVIDDSYEKCRTCVLRNHECSFSKPYQKRGPKPMPIQIPYSQLLNTKSLSNETAKPTLSNKCATCYKQKKKCTYNGMAGESKCEKCKKKKTDCLFQCVECKANTSKDNPFSSCIDCKVITKDTPDNVSVNCNIVTDVEVQKLYLRHSNCNHKIEITPALIDTMIKSYKAVDPTFRVTTFTTNDDPENSNYSQKYHDSHADLLCAATFNDTQSVPMIDNLFQPYEFIEHESA
ncbi:7456_t:CDS:2, partial [Cetraspora pellucida]